MVRIAPSQTRSAIWSSVMKLGACGSAPVEVDETFIGGKARNMHKSKRQGVITESGNAGRTREEPFVMGMLERGGKV